MNIAKADGVTRWVSKVIQFWGWVLGLIPLVRHSRRGSLFNRLTLSLPCSFVQNPEFGGYELRRAQMEALP